MPKPRADAQYRAHLTEEELRQVELYETLMEYLRKMKFDIVSKGNERLQNYKKKVGRDAGT